MKTIMTKSLITLAALTFCFAARAQAQNDPPESPAPQTSGTETNADDQQQVVGELLQAVVDAQQANDGKAGENTNGLPVDPKAPRPIRGQGSRGTAGSGTNVQSLASLVANASTNRLASGGKGLRLNFRNAPLSLVLDYLSDAAGFTISANSKVDLKGTVTVWSNQMVDRDEAVRLLHKALSEHSYAATVEGNVLNIYVLDSSNTDIVAGVPDNDYTNIPPTKELVTQIVYVRNVETGPLITTLQPLMPTGTSMSANQGANAIVITDTKANIRRMVQLVKALDTASVSDSKVAVFPLTYADATALAQVVTQLFQPDTSNSQGNRGGRGGGFFGGFPGFGGGGGGGGGGGSSTTQQGRVSSPKVTAVADDRSNALVVSASEDQMKLVKNLVDQMDVNVDQVTELRVFRLRYADPQETADQLASLFPDPTLQQNSRNQFRGFGPFGGFGGGNNASSTANQSTRKLSQTKVTAVADPRTGSVIVSASRDWMPQIVGIIEELDSDPAKKKKVFVIKVENRDPQEVVEELQSIISADTSGGNTTSSRSTSSQSGSQLNTRQQNNLRSQGNSSGSFNLGTGGTGGTRTGR
jgi:general secretion pathway protein D